MSRSRARQAPSSFLLGLLHACSCSLPLDLMVPYHSMHACGLCRFSFDVCFPEMAVLLIYVMDFDGVGSSDYLGESRGAAAASAALSAAS